MLGNPNLHDLPPDVAPQPVSEATTSTELRPDVAEPHYGEPDRSANAPPVPPATMRVQEFYTAESTASTTEERNVRWTARFTEFMRIAASRSASGWDRVLDNLGLHGQQAVQQQNMNLLSGRTRSAPLNFSPPEELPAATTTRTMQPPSSWTSTTPQQGPPLFSQMQVAQMRQSQREFPLLYGQSSEVGSDHSSRLQAEVQRQMEEYATRYQEELRALQGEVQQLRWERQEWEQRARGQLPSGVSRRELMSEHVVGHIGSLQ